MTAPIGTPPQVAKMDDPASVLPPDEAAPLVLLARACRAALHAVSLYPGDHPAIALALARLEHAGREATRTGPFQVAVLPSDLQIHGRSLPRTEAAAQELAALLHAHVIGDLTVEPGVEAADWRQFLALVGTPPSDVRDQGGIERAWTTGGGQRIQIREIDYAEVLDDRADGDAASWDLIVEHCLRGDAIELDDRVRRALAEIAVDPSRLAEFARRLEEQGEGAVNHATALLKLLTLTLGVFAEEGRQDQAEQILANMTSVVSGFPPEGMLRWIGAARARRPEGGTPAGTGGTGNAAEAATANPAAAVLARLSDKAVAQFIAGAVATAGMATGRLSQAFRALVPEVERRRSVLDLARTETAATPIGRSADFDRLWNELESLLNSYDDAPYVSKEYGRELDGANGWAATVDRIPDDPPERLAGWLSTVSDHSLRQLDVQLLLDLLLVEHDPAQWREIVEVVGNQLDDLVLVGDFASAARLLDAVLEPAFGRATPAVRQAGTELVDRLLAAQTLVHISFHLQTASDDEFEAVKHVCLRLGEPVIKPLTEMLVVEQQGRVRQRLTEILIGFGSLGRQSVEQLKQSPNPSVRRTAVYLLREFGGAEALPELEALVDDTEPHVQREAVRAILTIGTDEAYAVLQRALIAGGERARAAIFHQVHSAADERLAPLFCYILQHTGRRGPLASVALQVVGTLGDLGGDEAVDALAAVLRQGEWWAPFRTATFRRAAARALRRTGSERALALLREAAEQGPRGVRAAVRAALAEAESWSARSGGRREPAKDGPGSQ